MRRVIGVLSFILVVFLSASCSKNKVQPPIPKEAELVIKINTSEIAEKLLFEKAKDFKWDDLFSFGDKDSIQQKSFWEKLLNNPGKAGIDYLEPIYFFQYKSQRFIVVQLDNEGEFNDFIKGEKGKIVSLENGFSNFLFSPISISWNKKMVFFQLEENKTILKELLTLNKGKSIFDKPEFQEVISLSDDIVCYLSPGKLVSDNPILSQLKLLNTNSSVVRIGFEKGNIILKGEHLIQKESESLLKELNPAKYASVSNPKNIVSLCLNIDPILWERLDENTGSTMADKSGVTKEYLSKGLTGEFYGSISKINSGVKTFSTYEMDDDFNKVEITDSSIYYYPSLLILLPIQNLKSGENILNGLVKKGLLSSQNQSYTFDLLNFPVYLNLKDSFIIASDTSPKLSFQSNKAANDSSCFKLSIKPTEEIGNLFPFAKSLNALEQITILGAKTNGNLQFNGKIEFIDKNKNGLIQLIDLLKNTVPKDTTL